MGIWSSWHSLFLTKSYWDVSMVVQLLILVHFIKRSWSRKVRQGTDLIPRFRFSGEQWHILIFVDHMVLNLKTTPLNIPIIASIFFLLLASLFAICNSKVPNLFVIIKSALLRGRPLTAIVCVTLWNYVTNSSKSVHLNYGITFFSCLFYCTVLVKEASL